MQKSVQITVYVVKSAVKNQERVSGHRRRPLINACGGAGYDRKAQLLLYSQQLRNTACCQLKAASAGKKTQTFKKVKEDIQTVSSYKSQEKKKGVLMIRSNENSHQKVTESLLQIASSSRQQHPSANKVVPEELQKAVHAKLPQPPPSCFSDWRKFFLPSFIGRLFGSRYVKININNKKKKLSVSLSEKMKAIMMSSRMEKERIGATARFLSLTGKRS